MNQKSARALLGLALVLYFLWVAALASLVVLSAFRPGTRRSAAPAKLSALADLLTARDPGADAFQSLFDSPGLDSHDRHRLRTRHA
jgi:hypothetical protein